MTIPHEIYVIDDNSADVRILRDFCPPPLAACHFSVSVDGEEAINYVRNIANASSRPLPRIVILDLNLPRRNGTEVLAEMRSLPGWREIPVVVLSGSDDPKDKAQCLALGANQFITKPTSLAALETLYTVIQEYLREGV